MRPLVFICSPYRGDIQRNVEIARKMCRLAVLEGMNPFAPHLFYTQFMDDDDDEEREDGMDCGTQIMNLCSMLWIHSPDIGFSEGMKAEIDAWNGPYRIIHAEELERV